VLYCVRGVGRVKRSYGGAESGPERGVEEGEGVGGCRWLIGGVGVEWGR